MGYVPLPPSVRMAQELYVHRGRDTREQAAEAMARALG
jgi:hypothetical protein